MDLDSNVKFQYPQQIDPWMELKLPDDVVEYLWKIVKKGEEKNVDMKSTLAGNISQSFRLEDENYYFQNEICLPLAHKYLEKVKQPNLLKINHIAVDKNGKVLTPTNWTLALQSLWANYQLKHEFNPIHDHGGAFSFVVWLKIPYSCEEQKKLPFLNGTSDGGKVPGTFQFQYTNLNGEITNTCYQLDESYEGTMLFFPAKLRHGVHPFYETDEKRVSVSGNMEVVFQYE